MSKVGDNHDPFVEQLGEFLQKYKWVLFTEPQKLEDLNNDLKIFFLNPLDYITIYHVYAGIRKIIEDNSISNTPILTTDIIGVNLSLIPALYNKYKDLINVWQVRVQFDDNEDDENTLNIKIYEQIGFKIEGLVRKIESFK